ncbi:MAG: DUF5103 domain-containing protein [Bacteroidales bacterium]|nr:DUF5103 domain-containing protein [Bacteroidales bacterium]
MKKIILIVLLLGVGLSDLTAQFVYENRIYSPLVKTVTLHKSGNTLSEPVIVLNKNEHLYLEFDELREDTRRYEYTLIHCNSDWTKSELQYDQYLEGFEVQPIENYENSFNTIQRYVHYSQMIPSKDMHLIRSGNYVIKVFSEGNPDNVIFTRRMYVAEDRATIELEVKPSSVASLLNTHQEVNVRVKGKNGTFFSNPEQFMKVVVLQNGNDYTSHQLKFRAMSADKADFSFDVSNQFAAANEFRFFDFTSLRRHSQYIAGFDFLDNQHQVYLREERLRNKLPYSYDKDLNGQFYIRNEYEDNFAVTSDYAWVHFTYPAPQTLEGAYYVIGQMNDWHTDAQSIMKFKDGKYHLSMYLKQGYYNYHIAFRHNNDKEVSVLQTEGNFSQTNNVYSVFVYYHNFSDNCDEIAGWYSLEYNR